MIVLTDQNFEKEVLKSDIPVLVDFWAPWCGPCQMFAPILEEFAKEQKGKVMVGKLSVDENPQTAEKHGVMSIPTVILFKNGQEVKREMGLMPKEKLLEIISNF